MLHLTDYRELSKGKRYQMSNERELNHHGTTEEIANRSLSKIVEGENTKIEMLTTGRQ